MQNLGGQTECIMGNWKIVNVKKKIVPGKRDTSPAKSTLLRIDMRENLKPLPLPRTENSSRACLYCLALTELTQVSAVMEKKWLSHPNQNYVNGSASFVRERKESWLAWGRSPYQ